MNEHLRYEPNETLKRVCDFLGLAHLKENARKNIFSSPYLSEMGHREKRYLQHIFEYEIKNLERFLDWDCSDWLTD